MTVEVNNRYLVAKDQINLGTSTVLITPPINEHFWLMRVPLSDEQAIVCFPKFSVIGCGFQKEEDWNTNLPLDCDAHEIFAHIRHNKGDDTIKDDDCVLAIRCLQSAMKEVSK